MLYNGDLNLVYYIMFETLISGNKVRVKLRMIYDPGFMIVKERNLLPEKLDKGKTENTNARIQSNGVPFDKQHIKK